MEFVKKRIKMYINYINNFIDSILFDFVRIQIFFYQ